MAGKAGIVSKLLSGHRRIFSVGSQPSGAKPGKPAGKPAEALSAVAAVPTRPARDPLTPSAPNPLRDRAATEAGVGDTKASGPSSPTSKEELLERLSNRDFKKYRLHHRDGYKTMLAKASGFEDALNAQKSEAIERLEALEKSLQDFKNDYINRNGMHYAPIPGEMAHQFVVALGQLSDLIRNGRANKLPYLTPTALQPVLIVLKGALESIANHATGQIQEQEIWNKYEQDKHSPRRIESMLTEKRMRTEWAEFREFCAKERTTESVDFLSACQRAKDLRGDALVDAYRNILKDFIAPTATRSDIPPTPDSPDFDAYMNAKTAINLPSSIQKTVKAAIAALRSEGEAAREGVSAADKAHALSQAEAALAQAQDEIIRLLARDTLPRFTKNR